MRMHLPGAAVGPQQTGVASGLQKHLWLLPGVGHVTHALCDLLIDEIHDPDRRDLGWCAPKKSPSVNRAASSIVFLG
jgi:hypothetical protein